MEKTLIVYYSHSGNTKKVAEYIAKKTNGDLLALKPLPSYPHNYNAVLEQAKKEIQGGVLPQLEMEKTDLTAYHTVFLGTPNWWGTMAPPLASFLHKNNLSGKKAAVFCTHGGGGMTHVEKDAKNYGSSAEFLPGLAISGDGGSRMETTVTAWLEKIQEKA